MNNWFAWPVLGTGLTILAIVVPVLWHKHIPRFIAVPGALAILLVLVSFRPLMQGLGHSLGVGPMLILVCALCAAGGILTFLDSRPGGYLEARFNFRRRRGGGRKTAAAKRAARTASQRSGGGAGGNVPDLPASARAAMAKTGAGAGPARGTSAAVKDPHHLRPIFELSLFVFAGMLVYMNLPEVGHMFGSSWGQAVNLIGTHGKSA